MLFDAMLCSANADAAVMPMLSKPSCFCKSPDLPEIPGDGINVPEIQVSLSPTGGDGPFYTVFLSESAHRATSDHRRDTRVHDHSGSSTHASFQFSQPLGAARQCLNKLTLIKKKHIALFVLS